MQITPDELAILRQAAEIILRLQEPAPEKPAASFTVTRDWINANKTLGGAWKAKQLAAIDVVWPPAHGWPARVEGKQITETARALFESFAAPLGTLRPICRCKVMPWEDCPHMTAKILAIFSPATQPKKPQEPPPTA